MPSRNMGILIILANGLPCLRFPLKYRVTIAWEAGLLAILGNESLGRLGIIHSQLLIILGKNCTPQWQCLMKWRINSGGQECEQMEYRA